MKHKRIAALLLLPLLAALPLAAQNFQGTGIFQGIASEGQGIGKYIVNIAFVFSGIAAAICLVPAAIKAFKGESQAKDGITSLGLALIAVFIILSVIKAAYSFT